VNADLLATDGFTSVPQLVKQAGTAARGVYITTNGLIPGHLPPEGARFVERFARTQAPAATVRARRRARQRVEATAVYAAQAATVLLDAIARSNGTRGSVIDELFRTGVADGLLGAFRFDARGDADPGPVTVLRVRGPGRSRTILSMEGATVERVLRPSPSLVERQPPP
jgi:ABC-type branched-subunit amino acid transport system substrate-binding protein